MVRTDGERSPYMTNVRSIPTRDHMQKTGRSGRASPLNASHLNSYAGAAAAKTRAIDIIDQPAIKAASINTISLVTISPLNLLIDP